MVIESFLRYIRTEKRLSSHTVIAYNTDLTQFEDYLTITYGVSSDPEVTYGMIRSWLASLVDKGVVSRSVNRKLSTLKAYYRYLMKEGVVTANPVARAVSLKTPSVLPKFASVEQMESLQELAGETNDDFALRRDMLLIEILYCTGIRLSELINLKIGDINTGTKSIKVTGKRNKQRIIPVSEQLLNLISDYASLREQVTRPGVFELIITDRGRKAYPVFIYRKVKQYLTAAGVKGVRSPHVLRHTFATHMLNEGADLNVLKEILGHASLAATQVYTHNSIEKLKSIYKHAHPRA